jgi:hypothetical protein
MFLVDIHQLDVIFAQAICLCALEHEVHYVGGIFSLKGQDIVVLCSSEDFGQGVEVDTEGKVSVATKGREAFCLQHHRDKGNVGIVHCLERDSGVIAVEVAILHEIFDSIDHLSAL